MKNQNPSNIMHLDKRSYFFNFFNNRTLEIVESHRLGKGKFNRHRLHVYDVDIETFCSTFEKIDYTKRTIDQSESAQLKRRTYFFNFYSGEEDNVKFEIKESRALGSNKFDHNIISVYAVDLDKFIQKMEELIDDIRRK